MKIIIHQANGLNIGQRIEDGYINLTQMAKAYKKRVDNWLRLKDTEDLLIQFERQEKLNTSDLRSLKPPLIIKRGKHNGGTWGHPDIAIQFAQWLDKGFALQVSRWIREWMTTGKNPIQPSQSANKVTIENKLHALELLSQLEHQINHARLFRHTAHNITDQPIVSKNINRVVHRAMHEQGSILNDCMNLLEDLKELIDCEAAEKPIQQPVTQALPVIESQNVSESEPKPHYQTFIRKEARLTDYQLEQLTILARKLNRQRKGKGERITENTLIRIAVDLLLNNPQELDNLSFLELPESHFVADNQPTYLSFNRKEARLTENQLDRLTKLSRKLNRQKPTGDRITENTLIRSAVDLLLNQSERLKSKLQVI
jgi:hypothetical protein